MKKENLKPGMNVTVASISGEEFSGKVTLRSGVGEESNYLLSKESIVLENPNGHSFEIPFTKIKSVR